LKAIQDDDDDDDDNDDRCKLSTLEAESAISSVALLPQTC